MMRNCLTEPWYLKVVENPLESNWGGAGQGAFDLRVSHEGWRQVQVPHDLGIEGPIREHHGRPGDPHHHGQNAWLAGSLVWYRHPFNVKTVADKVFTLEFDGCYRQTDVWLNGIWLGREPNGFFPFQVDATRAMRKGENLLALRVNNLDTPNCRWYTGTGLIRPLWLWEQAPSRIAPHGLSITTPVVSVGSATVAVEADILGPNMDLTWEVELFGPGGAVAGHGSLKTRGGAKAKMVMTIRSPKLWDPGHPAMYDLKSAICLNDLRVDEQIQRFGIRSLAFVPQKGFLLNGVPTKMKGVCLHHDGGTLGAAVPDAVWAHRFSELKKIGCNAIRTSHNPPSHAFLDLCDTMGFLVMDEFCDKWEPPHLLDFEQSWHASIKSWIHRDRNHPSVVLYSVGNENDNPGATYLDTMLGPLCEKVREIDPTRPVIAALERGGDGPGKAALVRKSAAPMDLIGINYGEQWYEEIFEQDPRALIVGTENYTYFTSAPLNREAKIEKNAWQYVAKDPRVLGSFYWVGIDYLGEAYKAWPRIGSHSGLFDMTGFAKPRALLAACHWLEKPVVAFAVHLPRSAGPASMWDVPPVISGWDFEREVSPRQVLTVDVYSNCDEVVLSLNEKPFGKKLATEHPNHIFRWQVPFEPGTLLARGFRNGKEVTAETLSTPGKPAALRVANLAAKEQGVFIVEAVVVDGRGNPCVSCGEEIQFSVGSAQKILAVGNGDLTWHGPFSGSAVPLFRGRAVIFLSGPTDLGDLRVRAQVASLGLTG